MSEFLKDQLDSMRRASRRALRDATSETSLRELRGGVKATREQASEAAHVVAHSPVTQTMAKATRVAVANSGPVFEVAKICGRAGVAGAVVDGTMGTFNGLRAMKQGKIDGKQVLIHTGAEAGCGFVTSSTGTAGTIIVYMITGTMGPLTLVAGMGASFGSRYIYRRIVGETLPTEEATSGGVAANESKEAPSEADPSEGSKDEDEPFEKIGPGE